MKYLMKSNSFAESKRYLKLFEQLNEQLRKFVPSTFEFKKIYYVFEIKETIDDDLFHGSVLEKGRCYLGGFETHDIDNWEMKKSANKYNL